MIKQSVFSSILNTIGRIPPVTWSILTAVLCYVPAVFFGRAFFEFDSFTEGYAYASYFAGHTGNWFGAMYSNAYQSGVNLVFNPDVGLFGFLMTLAPRDVSDIAFWNVITGVFFVLFVWLAYIFFRDRSFDASTSAVLAMFVAFSQRFMTFFTSWIWVASYAVLPALCIVLKRFVETRKKRWVVMGGCVIAMAAFFAQPGILVFLILPCAAYAVFLLVGIFKKNRKEAVRLFCGMVAMGIVGIAVSAWYVVPMSRLAADTPRAVGLTFADAQVGALRVADIPQIFLPGWSLYTSPEPMLYMAALGLAFASLSLTHHAKDKEERFWRWTLLLCVVFAIPFSPLAWIANHLPVFNSARVPSRMLFAAAFAMAFLAGRGIGVYRERWESLYAGRASSIVRVTARVFVVVISTGALFGAFGGFGIVTRLASRAFDRFLYARTTGMSLAHYHDVIASMVTSVADLVRLTNPTTIIVFAGLLCTATLFSHRSVASQRTILVMLALTSCGYGLIQAWHAERVSAAVITQEPQTAKFIHSQTDADRFREFTLFFGSSKFELLDTPLLGQASPEDQYAYGRDLLAPNANIRYGIQSIDGYDNFATRRTSNLLNEVLSEAMPTGNMVARRDIPRSEKISIFNDRLNVLGMMNVKYILSAYELPTSTLSIVWTGDTTSQHIPIRIYQNPLVLPRVFLAPSVQVIPEDEAAALSEVLKPGKDFEKETLLECSSCTLMKDFKPDPSDSAGIISYQSGDVVIHTSTTQSRLLVFNENRLQGWRVTVDDAPYATYFANYLYQGVFVSAGVHEVKFRYIGP